jgi:hypothetical protein
MSPLWTVRPLELGGSTLRDGGGQRYPALVDPNAEMTSLDGVPF